MKKLSLIFLVFPSFPFGFTKNEKIPVDLIVYNAVIYTVDSTFNVAEAMAIKDGRIISVGKNSDLENQFNASHLLDAKGKFIYPGFIDAHAHFYSYGSVLQVADLTGSNSWDEALNRLKKFDESNKIKGWIIGRGWDQNRWPDKQFPTKDKLDKYFPSRPILLTRIDGHAAIANQKALNMAGVKAGMKINGGIIEVKNGKLTGILIDNAIGIVGSKIPAPDKEQVKYALLNAQKNCFAAGLTTVDDCGLNYDLIMFIDSLQSKGELRMRMFIMLSDSKENYEFAFNRGKIKTDRLNVSSFKVYADGTLGSRGACLLQPYSDRPGWNGFLLSPKEHFDSVAKLIYDHGFQMCTHAIGDSGNRVILDTYAKYLKGKNDLRWRIEHAQVVNLNDFDLFGQYSIVPSVQPTHATSDMYWAEARLGKERMKGAYAYKQLLRQNGWIPLGTDFPVEDISPIKTFYAAVFRKDTKGFPPKGFQVENALTREEALRGMTIWAAKANFEEKEKGSLELGKFADFVILNKDIMKIHQQEVLTVKVIGTYVGGEKVSGF